MNKEQIKELELFLMDADENRQIKHPSKITISYQRNRFKDKMKWAQLQLLGAVEKETMRRIENAIKREVELIIEEKKNSRV